MLNGNATFFLSHPPPAAAPPLKQQCELSRWRKRCSHKTIVNSKGITILAAAASADPSFTFIIPTRLFPQSTTLRLMGSVSTPAHGFGKILALDEFFSGPSEAPLPNHDGLQETIIYHLSEAMASNLVEAEEEAALSQPQHGLQLYIKSSLQQTTPVPDHALISHLKDASSVPAVLLEDADGGARVKVIAGIFGGLASSFPQDQSLMLDVQMRPGSQVDFPLESSFSNLVYVVEGVGIFHAPQLMPNGRPSYQNEGHGFVISPTTGCSKSCKLLRVSTHPCSHLRFILLGAAPLLERRLINLS